MKVYVLNDIDYERTLGVYTSDAMAREQIAYELTRKGKEPYSVNHALENNYYQILEFDLIGAFDPEDLTIQYEHPWYSQISDKRLDKIRELV